MITRISKRGWRRLAALVRGREAEQLAEVKRVMRADAQRIGEDYPLRPRDVRRALEDRDEIRRMLDED